MLFLRVRRSVAILLLTAAVSLTFPQTDLRAHPRMESRWRRVERSGRIADQGFSFWNFLTIIFEGTGMRIDENG